MPLPISSHPKAVPVLIACFRVLSLTSLAQQSFGDLAILYVSVVHSFLLLSSVPWYRIYHSLTIYLLKQIWVDLVFGYYK